MMPHTYTSLSLMTSLFLNKPLIFCSGSALFYSSSRVLKLKVEIRTSDYLISRRQFSPGTTWKVSQSVTYLKNPKNSDAVLLFLQDSGFSDAHIEITVKYFPAVLLADLDKTLRPKIKMFQDLGFSSTDIAEIISRDPWILSRCAAGRLVPSILTLKTVLGSVDNVAKLLKTCGWFLKDDLEKTLLPNIEYMESCGIPLSQIVKCLLIYHRFFLCRPETIRNSVKRADEMGMNRKSKMFIHAIRVLSSMTLEKWELRLQVFRDLGFTEDDILDVFRRKPVVFSHSARKIIDLTQLLLSVGNHDISLIIKHPDLLLCSIDRRIKPRLRVMEILEKRNVLRRKPSLTTVCMISKKQFLERYVTPYSNELEGEYKAGVS